MAVSHERKHNNVCLLIIIRRRIHWFCFVLGYVLAVAELMNDDYHVLEVGD